MTSKKNYTDLNAEKIVNKINDLTIGEDDSNILTIASKINIPRGDTGQVLTKQSDGSVELATANSFKTISISGQSDIVADSSTDTLTLVAGSNMTLTTNAGTDTITLASTDSEDPIGMHISAHGNGWQGITTAGSFVTKTWLHTSFTEVGHWCSETNGTKHMVLSTGIFTCPVAGYYYVSTNQQMYYLTSGWFRCIISLNNVDTIYGNNTLVGSGHVQCTSGNHDNASVSSVIKCAANDNLRIKVQTSSDNGWEFAGQSHFSVYMLKAI